MKQLCRMCGLARHYLSYEGYCIYCLRQNIRGEEIFEVTKEEKEDDVTDRQ